MTSGAKARLQHGKFLRFAALLPPEGKIRAVGVRDAPDDAESEEILERLTAGIREGVAGGEYRAVATFALVELREPADGKLVSAVHVALEHEAGYRLDVYYPTVLEGERLVLGQAFAGHRSGSFFPCAASRLSTVGAESRKCTRQPGRPLTPARRRGSIRGGSRA